MKPRFKLPLVFLLAAVLVVCDNAEPTQGLPQDVGVAGDGGLQAVLDTIRLARELPALAAISVYNGVVVERAATGLRAVGHVEEAKADDLWHLGSLTKSITATLAAALVERGILSWDTTVGAILPDLVGSMHEQYVDVRLRELLYHTGGLPVDVSRAPSWGSLFADTSPIIDQRIRFATELLAISPGGPRGEFAYSNAGYVVAGVMMERVTGDSWEELISREVFVPLGMSSCSFGAPGGPERDQPWGHRGRPGKWNAVPPGPYADNPAALGPAGTVHCSLEDYARYMVEHLAGANGGDGIVSSASFQELHTPPSGSNYAMGWGIGTREWAGGRVLSHHGSNTMWWASVWLAPELGLGLFSATNAAGDEAFAGADDAVAALLGRFQAASQP
jgi:CubicO group peptidase (beta-lactamase class C family)